MIQGISFHILDYETLEKKTREFNPMLLSDTHLTRIGSIAVLPFDCYPNIKRPDGIYKDNLHKLYNDLYKSIQNDAHIENIEKQKNAVIQEIQNRWKGKHGRWRQDICGKRCNFTARSVLTPNPYLHPNQVGIPCMWKNRLTLLEKWKENMVAVYVVEGNTRFSTKYRKPTSTSMVYRQLKEGELVLVNRQPTLRQSNFVAMELVWISEKTVQMHPAIFSMFDADCDGDEINIHLPQVPQAELYTLHINHCLTDFGTLKLAPSVIQDAMVGLHLYDVNNTKNVIHNSLLENSNAKMSNILFGLKKSYIQGCKYSYMHGFSVGLDFSEVDIMIHCGAKGKIAHKSQIRKMLTGIYDEDEHFKQCMEARVAMISTSLKTAETGYISRRMAYYLDDVCQDKYGVRDYGTMYIQFPSQIPHNLRHVKNIGLYLVTIFMPPLTQKMLDSFHAASAGETVVDHNATFVSLINCTSPELLNIYKTKGIIHAKHFLYENIVQFFGNIKIHSTWIHFLVDYLCVTGEPIGMSMTNLQKRIKMYQNYDKNIKIPVLKLCKFGKPFQNLMTLSENNTYDDLKSFHSYELFY